MLNQNNAYRMLCWTVVSVLMLWSAGDAGALRIRNTATGETFQIGDQGTITTDMTAQPDQGMPLDPATGSLVFTKGEDATVAMGDGEVRVAGPLHAPGITQVATEDMTIENPNLAGDQPQAVLKKEGAFVATGGISDNGIPVAAVAYFDDMAVFESDASADMQLAYANLDGEGRVEFGETTDAVHFYIRDHLGSTRMVITDDGQGNPQIVESNAYLAYGTKRTLSGGGAVELRDEFTGKEYDEEGSVDGVTKGIETYHFGLRMYDPEIGRWLRPDPSQQFSDRYAYAGNGFNPVNSFDPDGGVMTAEQMVGGGGGGSGGAGAGSGTALTTTAGAALLLWLATRNMGPQGPGRGQPGSQPAYNPELQNYLDAITDAQKDPLPGGPNFQGPNKGPRKGWRAVARKAAKWTGIGLIANELKELVLWFRDVVTTQVDVPQEPIIQPQEQP